MNSTVVVGGGVVGIFSAIILKEKYDQVTLIEKEANLGGLLRSFKNKNGISFDYGTHIPAETLVPEIDEILFGEIDEQEWEIFKLLQVGNFFEGKSYPDSSYIYTPYLPQRVYEQGLTELLACNEEALNTKNLKEYTQSFYGNTFSEYIYRPIMKKLLGEELENLHQSAHTVFGYNRLIPGNKEMAKELKKSPIYDKKLAYASYQEGMSANKKFYPKNNKGVELWINQLVQKAKKAGVHFRTSSEIRSIKQQNNRICEITLRNNESIKTDLLIWTAAPIHLLNGLNVKMPNQKVPKFRSMTLHNLVFDKPFKIPHHYFYCSDPKFRSFRITLYPNLTETMKKRKIYNCTIEVLSEGSDDTIDIVSDLKKELVEMGIIDDTFELISKDHIQIKYGFPVITNDFVEATRAHKQVVESETENVILLGKASGEVFFMNDSIIDAYKKLSSYFMDGR